MDPLILDKLRDRGLNGGRVAQSREDVVQARVG
jgi:hypothetical protein